MRGYIAIDGGGTKTEVVLVNELGFVSSRLKVNCTNPNNVTMDAAYKTLEKAIKDTLKIAKKSKIEVINVSLYIAGIEFGDEKQILTSLVKNKFKKLDVYVDGDLKSVEEAGLGNDENGVVIIAGTGYNIAIKKNNIYDNVGGWGHLPDDVLSGYDLGKDALIYASNAINGLGPETSLTDKLEKENGHSLWYSMKEIYEGGVKKVASYARLVIEAYKENDKVARSIIDTRIDRLVRIIKLKTSKMKQVKVSLFGGIFENNEFIVDSLKEKLGDNYLVNVSDRKTIQGACYLGAKNMNVKVDEEFEKNFENSYKGVQCK